MLKGSEEYAHQASPTGVMKRLAGKKRFEIFGDCRCTRIAAFGFFLQTLQADQLKIWISFWIEKCGAIGSWLRTWSSVPNSVSD